jgi:hypothetical protein
MKLPEFRSLNRPRAERAQPSKRVRRNPASPIRFEDMEGTPESLGADLRIVCEAFGDYFERVRASTRRDRGSDERARRAMQEHAAVLVMMMNVAVALAHNAEVREREAAGERLAMDLSAPELIELIAWRAERVIPYVMDMTEPEDFVVVFNQDAELDGTVTENAQELRGVCSNLTAGSSGTADVVDLIRAMLGAFQFLWMPAFHVLWGSAYGIGPLFISRLITAFPLFVYRVEHVGDEDWLNRWTEQLMRRRALADERGDNGRFFNEQDRNDKLLADMMRGSGLDRRAAWPWSQEAREGRAPSRTPDR